MFTNNGKKIFFNSLDERAKKTECHASTTKREDWFWSHDRNITNQARVVPDRTGRNILEDCSSKISKFTILVCSYMSLPPFRLLQLVSDYNIVSFDYYILNWVIESFSASINSFEGKSGYLKSRNFNYFLIILDSIDRSIAYHYSYSLSNTIII